MASLAVRITTVGWIATGPEPVRVPYLSRDLLLGRTDVYFFDAYTAEACRGKGYPRIRSALNRRVLSRLGYRRAVALVAPENTAAMRAVKRSGYRELGVYRLLRLGVSQIATSRAYGQEALLPLVVP